MNYTALVGALCLVLASALLGAETVVRTDNTSRGDWTVTVAAGSVTSVVVPQTGPGAIVKRGDGMLILGATGAYSGGTAVEAGVLEVTNRTALGSGAVSVAGRTTSLQFKAPPASGANYAVVTNALRFTGGEDVGYSGNYSDNNNCVVFYTNTHLTADITSTRSIRLRHNPRSTATPTSGGPSTVFDGRLDAPGKTVFLNVYGTMEINGPVTAAVLSGGEAWSGGGLLKLTSPASRIGRLILCNNKVSCGAADVLGDAELYWRLTGSASGGLSLVDIGGHDQSVAALSHHYFGSTSWDDARFTSGNYFCVKSTNPATLTVTGLDTDATAYATLRGAVSLVVDAAEHPGFRQTFAANANPFTGSVTVRRGTLALADGASFTGLSGLTVEDGGRFDAADLTSAPFGTKRIPLTLATGARVAFPDGQKVELSSLKVGGRLLAPGVYFPENLPQLEHGVLLVYDASGKLPSTTGFTAPAVIAEPTAVVGDQTWEIPANTSLVFDNAIRYLGGTVRVKSPLGTSDATRGHLVFTGTNVIDGALFSTAAVVRVSGLLATPGHIDQGVPSDKGPTSITLNGQNGKGYLFVSNAVIEKPIYLKYSGYGAIKSAAGTTNVFKGFLTWPQPWLGFTAAKNSELVFDGGFATGWSLRTDGGGTIRIRDTSITATNSLGWNVGTGTLALDVAGNRIKYLTAGHQNGNTSVIDFGVSQALDPETNVGLLCGVYWSDHPSQYMFLTSGSGTIRLHDTVQRVKTLAGGPRGTITGENGARIEILRQVSDENLFAPETCLASKLEGDVTLAMYGTGTFVLTNRTFETAGALIVTNGTVEIAANAAWKGSGGVSIGGRGRLKVRAATAFDATVTDLRISEHGMLEIPAGVTLSVRTLDVESDGVWYRYTTAQDFGGASGVLAGRIAGGGVLHVAGVPQPFAGEMPLEWNVTYPTDVPYEVEIDAERLAALSGVSSVGGFAVFATVGGERRQLSVTTLEGRRPGVVALHFNVPASTTALACRALDGLVEARAADAEDLFADALLPTAVWKLDTGLVRTDRKGGILFYNPVFASGRYAKYSVAVPERLRGKPVRLEVDCVSESRMTWGGHIRIRQYDASGAELPECVVDPRWTGHMRPPAKLTEYRETGRLHPQAATVAACFEIRSTSTSWDNWGLPLADPEDVKARLFVTRLALRPARELPFPKYDDGFFAAGVSGEPGDAALRLGGAKGEGFFYATRSQAAWAEGDQVRDEAQVFFPSGAGTVEAWFRPEAWPAKETYLFQGYHYNVPKAKRNNRGDLMSVKYKDSSGTLTFRLKDMSNQVYTCSCVCPLQLSEWTHLAAQWTVGANATMELFVNGVRKASATMKRFVPLDLANETCPNDEHVCEFFFGSHFNNARDLTTDFSADYPLFEGAADLLRVSTGTRYAADGFVPSRSFAVDGATRALFTFDRTFDGASGGGLGFVRGSIRALTDRVQHTLAFGDRTLQYLPDAIPDGINPKKVLDLDNYPVLPKPDDFHVARAAERRRFSVRPGDRVALTAPAGVISDYVEIANTGRTRLLYPMLVNDSEVDPRSFGDIAETMRIEEYPFRERADRIFQYVIGASDYFMNHSAFFTPGTDTPGDVEYQALTMLNAYCGFECGPLNNMTVNLFACAGRCPASQTGGYGHSFEQVFYDGKNHIYDLSAQTFITAMDNETAAYLEEASDQPGCFHRLGFSPEHSIRKSTRSPEAGNPAYREKAAMSLNPGERFRVWYDNNGECNDLQCASTTGSPRANYNERCHATPGSNGNLWRVNRFVPQYGSGFLVYEGPVEADNPAFASVGADGFVYSVLSAYPVVAATYTATLTNGAVAATWISTDRGQSWRPLPEGLLRYEVRARTEYLVRFAAPPSEVASFKAVTEVQVNARIFPGRLHAGANELTFKANGGDSACVTVGYRRPAKAIEIRGGVYAGTIPGAEREFVLLDPAKELVLDVTGASAATTVRTYGGLAASYESGRLRISAGTARKGFAAVDLVDGAAVKELTVLVCANARLVVAGDALTAGGSATLAAADAGRVQPCIAFAAAGGTATAAFETLPKGKYAVLTLNRFPSHDKDRLAQRLFLEALPGCTKLACGYTVNDSCNYYKAHYGRKGVDTRGNFKWDYPYQPGTSYYTHMMNVYDVTAAFSSLNFSFPNALAEGVELAAALVVPVDKSVEEEFYCELVKVLCGLNTRPWKVTPGRFSPGFGVFLK